MSAYLPSVRLSVFLLTHGLWQNESKICPFFARRKIILRKRMVDGGATSLEESLLQNFFMWNCQRQSCNAFIGLTIRAKMISWGNPFYTWNFGSIWQCWGEIADFRSIFARSASAVTPSGKSSINTNRKSTTRFPMSPRWTSYVVPKPPQGAQNAKCPKFEQLAAITPKRKSDSESQLLKSHISFRLVPTSMTLNDLERRNSPYFALFHRIR